MDRVDCFSLFDLVQLFLETDLRGHTDSVMYLRWHPKDEHRLVSTSGQEQNIRFWDARASKNTATLSTPGNNLYIAWNHDGNYVAVGNRQDGANFVILVIVRWFSSIRPFPILD